MIFWISWSQTTWHCYQNFFRNTTPRASLNHEINQLDMIYQNLVLFCFHQSYMLKFIYPNLLNYVSNYLKFCELRCNYLKHFMWWKDFLICFKNPTCGINIKDVRLSCLPIQATPYPWFPSVAVAKTSSLVWTSSFAFLTVSSTFSHEICSSNFNMKKILWLWY